MQRQAKGTRPSIYLRQAGSLREYASRRICELFLCILVVLTGPVPVSAQQGFFSTIDVPGVSSTEAFGINNAGQIVGRYYAFGGYHGFLLTGGSLSPIDVPGAYLTQVYGINDAGQIVGRYDDAKGIHGFLYMPSALPSITSRFPEAGAVGSQVTITGQNFGTSGTVQFDTTPATILSPWSDTVLVVQVPSLPAGMHNVTVTTSAGQSNAVQFQITELAIDHLSPVSGPVGTQAMITGQEFGTSQGSSIVTFDATPVSAIVLWSNTQIVIQVPDIPAKRYDVAVITSTASRWK